MFGSLGSRGGAKRLRTDNSLVERGATKLLSVGAPAPLRGYIDGLVLSNNGSDAINDIDIAAGIATDDGVSAVMELSAGLTKQLDATFAAGTNAGMLDTGSAANTTYHLFLIQRSDTGATDILASTSATAPTMPAGYDRKRIIGSIIRAGGTILAFTQYGDEFDLVTPVNDVNDATSGTGERTDTLTVPIGISVNARVAVYGYNGSYNFYRRIYSPDQANVAVVDTSANFTITSSAAMETISEYRVRTNTSGQVKSRSNGTDYIYINTWGWTHPRGKDA